MAVGRRSGGRGEVNTWPGFVDAMTALLLILMFVMSIFMIIQFTMHEKLTGQSKELDDLTSQLAGLAGVLALEKTRNTDLEGQVGALKANIAGQAAEVDRLNAAMAALVKTRDAALAQVDTLQSSLGDATSARQALEAALASARQETDAATEAARLAAAKREAMESLVADLQAKDAKTQAEMATITADRASALAMLEKLQASQAADQQALSDREKELADLEEKRKQALALIADLQAERDKLTAQGADAASRLAAAQGKLTDAEQQRLLEAQAAEMLRQRLADLDAKLTDEEKGRLAEAAAAEALKKKLAESTTELDAMTLALDKARKDAEDTLIKLAAAEQAKKALQGQLSDGGAAIDREQTLRQMAESELAKAQAQTVEEQKRVALLNAQVKELREQLGGLQALLGDAERRDSESQVQIAKLGERLNAALAQKVGELARFRSVFFEKMDKVLGGRQDIKRVGDRFVFQSEVLFDPGSADLDPKGQAVLDQLGKVLRDVTAEMPKDLNWILRVDGHTDKIPVGGSRRFKDNWELSQARALSVVRFLIDKEQVPPERLAAAGFGEFQPIDPGNSPEALARNRRIEFKFTER